MQESFYQKRRTDANRRTDNCKEDTEIDIADPMSNEVQIGTRIDFSSFICFFR